MLEAHDRKTQFSVGSWVHDGNSVPFYPRFITRSRGITENDVALELIKLGPVGGGTAIKDSRATLNLDSRNFKVLLESHWIACRTNAEARRDDASEWKWSRVSGIEDLEAWCSSWARLSNVAEELARDLFKTILLENQNVSFLIRTTAERTVGVAITFENDHSVGISNFMSEDAFRQSNWDSLASYLENVQPQMTLVGYENGPDLEAALAAGFEELGPLKIWVKTEQPH